MDKRQLENAYAALTPSALRQQAQKMVAEGAAILTHETLQSLAEKARADAANPPPGFEFQAPWRAAVADAYQEKLESARGSDAARSNELEGKPMREQLIALLDRILNDAFNVRLTQVVAAKTAQGDYKGECHADAAWDNINNAHRRAIALLESQAAKILLAKSDFS